MGFFFYGEFSFFNQYLLLFLWLKGSIFFFLFCFLCTIVNLRLYLIQSSPINSMNTFPQSDKSDCSDKHNQFFFYKLHWSLHWVLFLCSNLWKMQSVHVWSAVKLNIRRSGRISHFDPKILFFFLQFLFSFLKWKAIIFAIYSTSLWTISLCIFFVAVRNKPSTMRNQFISIVLRYSSQQIYWRTFFLLLFFSAFPCKFIDPSYRQSI